MTVKNTKRNTFLFEGGEKLTTIGASFFVSYLYHQKIDSSHKDWQVIKTQRSRISTINATNRYHQTWLDHILRMNEKNLGKNTIGLDGAAIKKMAVEIQRRDKV